MTFFLNPKNIYNKVKISNRKKKLLELLRARNINLIQNKKIFLYNELLNKSRPLNDSAEEGHHAEVEAVAVADAMEFKKIPSEADMNKYVTNASKRLNMLPSYPRVLPIYALTSIANQLLDRKLISKVMFNDYLSANSRKDKLEFLYELQFGQFDDDGAEEEKT